MMILDATIQADRLQHAIKVLRRVNDEVIFKIQDGKIVSRVVNLANVAVVQVEIDATEGHIATSEPHTVGVDLGRLAGSVTRASAKDLITIEADDLKSWQIARGVHQRTMRLLNPEQLRKYSGWVDLPHTATVTMSGRMFKEIIAEAAALKTDFVTAHATEEKLIIEAISKDMEGDTYTGTLLELMCDSEAVGMYDCDYLQDIAADMKAADEMMFKFSTDHPCEIEYEREGVTVQFILAPRIE